MLSKTKDFKELFQNYNEFINLINEKIEKQREVRQFYNAFKDRDNLHCIYVVDETIFIDVIDGDDTYHYEVPIHEFTNSEEDKKLYVLKTTRNELVKNKNKELDKLSKFELDLETYENMNKKFGVSGTYYDIVKVEQMRKEFQNTIKTYKKQIDEIDEQISEITNEG